MKPLANRPRQRRAAVLRSVSALLPLGGLGFLWAWLTPVPALPPDHQGLCRTEVAGSVEYIVCSVPLDRYELKLFAADPDGKPFAGFRAMADSLPAPPLLAVNAGMFDHDYRPVGLAVQDGVQIAPISTADGPGNFHMKPNGIFFIEGGKAAVRPTDRYRAEGHAPDLATQSGPMLLIDGELHPRFIKGSDSRFVRNGVGVSEDGRIVYLVLSRQPVNFWDFALFFRDRLSCRDALFLDGQISGLFYPAADIDYQPYDLGPMLAVLPKADG
ncbi:phosphodiester glycosidase family protein [Consotaella aegiceratis]|uniref:phosphodiester glycosidase family protein n=1 Tax=Consotaella aegiceratis TaxID=3097961 RepID=UPI002F41B74D